MGEIGVKVDGQAVARKGRVVFGEDGLALPTNRTSAEDEDDDDDDDDEIMWSDEDDESDTPPTTTSTLPLSKAALTARRRQRAALGTKQRQLTALQDREEQLALALRQLEAQRGRMGNVAGGVNKSGVAFKQRERKR